MSQFVTHRQWDSYCTRVFNANIKRAGHSVSPAGISCRANSYIVEIRDDGMIVKDGWKTAMKIEDKNNTTETMQQCSTCGNWCRRTVNVCPTCARKS